MKKDPVLAKMLNDAFDWSQGKHSGIPECCIHVFLNGRIYHDFSKTLTEKDRIRLHKNWEYVPCDACFKYKKGGKVKKNGTSLVGKMLMTLLAEANGHDPIYYGDRGLDR